MESGARNVDNILTNTLLPDISRKILGSMAEGEKMTAMHVSVGEDGEFSYNDPDQHPGRRRFPEIRIGERGCQLGNKSDKSVGV